MSGLILEWMPVIAALLAAGVAAGILAGLLGVGGGIVLVPVLFTIFQSLGVSGASAMVIATGTSLLAIVPTSISSSRAHHRRSNIDLALFRRWWLPMLAGVLLGASMATRVNGLVLTALFGCV
ncbi:MAG TPA: sulfite exporter TauE/SafE family protein, partial [Kineobactrum sp.]